MSLAFLSKKSFHTANLSNQEKVWMAEQRKAAEEAKTKELSKQIQEEREREELEKMTGRVSSKIDRGIDWMYQGGLSYNEDDAKRKEEEYLLGKEFVAEGGREECSSGLDRAVSSSVLSKREESGEVEEGNPNGRDIRDIRDSRDIRDWNEEFRLRVEDPMFLVSQRLSQRMNDQHKKRALYRNLQPQPQHNHRTKSKKRSRRSRSPTPLKRHTSPSPPKKHSNYGLQGPQTLPVHPSNLGPEPSLLIAQRDRKHREIAHLRSRKHSRTHRSQREKELALESMRLDARKREATKHKCVKVETHDEHDTFKNPTFLKDVGRTLHGVDHHVSMADRVSRNRHTNLKSDAD